MGIIRAVCGGDEYCYMELWGFVESLSEIDRKLSQVRIEGPLGASAPIAVSTPEETMAEMSEKLYTALRDLGYEIDKESVERGSRGSYAPEDRASSFASFVFKRLLYKTARESGHSLVSESWDETYCPVCGLIPVASIEEKESGGSYALRYKCLCGNSWRRSVFTCPNCKTTKTEDFEVHYIGRVPAYFCRNCGHIILVASSSHVESQTDEEILPIVAALAANAILEAVSGEHEEHEDEKGHLES